MQRHVGAIDANGRGVVVTEDAPDLTRGTVLVKVHASLISPGTELMKARQYREGPNKDMKEPAKFGYQNAGVVLDVGEGVTQFKPGDRVACMGSGRAQHTDLAVVPQNLCCLLPGNVTFEQGAFAHLAMTSLWAVRRGQPELGEYLLVVGLGLVGQMAARLGQIAGQYAMGWDMVPFRCEVAQGWGIDGTAVVGQEDETQKAADFTRGLGFDMAIMAFGGKATEALMSVRNAMSVSADGHQCGRISMVGGAATETPWGAAMGNLDLRSCSRTGPGYHDKRWELGEVEYPDVFVRWSTRRNMEYVLRLMSEGKLDVASLVTHRVPLADIDEAITAHIERPDSTLGTVLLMR